MIGGTDDGTNSLNSVEVLDNVTGLFSTLTPTLSTGRKFHSATTLADGRILIAGGSDAAGAALASADILDPTSGFASATIGATGDMTTGRSLQTATRLARWAGPHRRRRGLVRRKKFRGVIRSERE